MGQQHIIKEYDSFTRNKAIPGSGYIRLTEHTFDQLEMFILANRSTTETEALELMSITSRRGIGKMISAKNYVGLITMKDGTEIEILPKIYSEHSCNQEMTKKIFLDMLKTVKDVPYKAFNVSHLKAEHMNVFEVFVRMFIEEVYDIIKRGLKASYSLQSDNERFFKGKILFPQHIKANYVHKEKVFVEYDIFSTNRPENRLIKSTIRFLHQRTTSTRNKKDLSVLLTTFDEIGFSSNYKNDFSQYIKNQNMSEYDMVMQWCKVFLLNRSFTAFAGSEVAFALLFPMEQVFESYIAAVLKRRLDKVHYSIKTQDRQYHLFDHPAKKFSLRPDIVITDKSSNSAVVLDTKWKLLSSSFHNYGISQSDMYQMYAYHKKYHAKQVILLYPMTENVKMEANDIVYVSEDGITVKVIFIDLTNIKESMDRVLEM